MGQQDSSGWQLLVVAYNSEQELPRLVESVEAHFPTGTSVAIWCNSDVERLRLALADVVDGSAVPVEVHGDGTNFGFAEACNRLAALSTSDTVLFVNPDTEVLAFRAAVEPAGSRNVAPLIYTAAGELQRTFGEERTLRREAALRLLRREPDLEEPSEPTVTGFVSGAAFAVDRQRFLEVGGFDPDYFMYYEDLDLCRRWRASGGSIWVDPGFRLMHVGGASASSNPLLALQRSYESALTYHSTNRVSRLAFQCVAMLEGLLKSLLAALSGRAGRVDRRTQWKLTRWMWFRGLRRAR
jgi:GT2 family glycosyltransferase